MKPETLLFKTYWEDDDIEAVSSVIKRGSFWADGPEIAEFEKRIADFTGSKHALAFNSGTSALHTILLASGIAKGEVIVPSFTFTSTVNAVVLAGGEPVFAESEGETYGLDAEDVAKRVTDRTRAIIALHYAGFPSRDIGKLRKIADENNILLIEDAAESLGAGINGKKAGTFGNSAIFSFCQNKVLSTGEGGMIVTDSRELYEKAKLIRSHGRDESKEDYFSSTGDNDYICLGYNFRMPTMSAALGLSQLGKLQKIIDMRREKAEYMSRHLSGIKGLRIPAELEGHYAVYQMYTIQLKDEKTRDALQEHMTKNGIMTKVYFNPVHMKTVYSSNEKYRNCSLPKTESLSKRVLTLPFYPGITEKEMDLIISCVKIFFENFLE